MEREEMKNVILELFEQQRQLNARLIEMQRIIEEKEQSIAMLTRRIDELIALIAQRQQGDSETTLAMQRQWEKERESFKKTISDLQDIIKVLKADKFKGTSQKKRRKVSDKDGGDNGSSTAAGQSDLSELKADFDGRDADGSIASAADRYLTTNLLISSICAAWRMPGQSSNTHLIRATRMPTGSLTYVQQDEPLAKRCSSATWRADGEGSQLSSDVLDPAYSMEKRWTIRHRQHIGRTLYPATLGRKEELTLLWLTENGSCLGDLPHAFGHLSRTTCVPVKISQGSLPGINRRTHRLSKHDTRTCASC